jgi:ribonuclease HI
MDKRTRVIAYADGSCIGNPGPGGWGVVLIRPDGSTTEYSGAAPSTTNNRMEIMAAIEALRGIRDEAEIIVRSDSRYLVNTMTRGWKRKENLDLWKMLDAEAATRKVQWEWVAGHASDEFNNKADRLARNAALGNPKPKSDSLPSASLVESIDLPQAPQSVQIDTHSSPVAGPSDQTGQQGSQSTENEIARALRSLLREGETLRRCSQCGRAFVANGNPPRGEAYCSLVACQLKARGHLRD